jgi:starvation-inducible outer membrane lipoprotein
MTPLDKTHSFLLVFLLGACFTIPAFSQNVPPTAASDAATSQVSPRVLTGKERLGRKWMDEQRIDNCNVPIDKRGTKTRPSGCHSAPTG